MIRLALSSLAVLAAFALFCALAFALVRTKLPAGWIVAYLFFGGCGVSWLLSRLSARVIR